MQAIYVVSVTNQLQNKWVWVSVCNDRHINIFNCMVKDLHQNNVLQRMISFSQSQMQTMQFWVQAHESVLSVWMMSASDHAAQVWRWLLEDIKLDGMKLRASSKSMPVQLWYTIITLQQFYKPLLISHHPLTIERVCIPWHNMIFIWRLPCVYALWFIWQSILFVSNLIYSSVK